MSSSFRDLKVWRDAMDLVVDVYTVTKSFPVTERFGLTAQLRRAAVSVPSNIGEGKRRRPPRARAHHFDIALGSQGEMEVQLEIAHRSGLLARTDYERLSSRAADLGRMLHGLLDAVEAEINAARTTRDGC